MGKFPESIESIEAQLERHIPAHRVPPLGPHRLSVGDPDEIRSIGDAFLGDPLPPFYDTTYYRPTKDLMGIYKGVGVVTSRALICVDKLGNAQRVEDENDLLFRVSLAGGVLRRRVDWYHDPHALAVSDARVAALALQHIHAEGWRRNGTLERLWKFRQTGAQLYDLKHPYHKRLDAQFEELLGRAIEGQMRREQQRQERGRHTI